MIAKIMNKQILTGGGTLHDVNHFLKVWGYAKTIGELEGLDADTQHTLEIAAILHDIACPKLRAETGRAEWRRQELEGGPMAREFLREFPLPEAQKERVVFLVGHHHSPEAADGIDFRILLEADYLVNADEHPYAPDHVRRTYDGMFRTESGRRLLRSMYGLE